MKLGKYITNLKLKTVNRIQAARLCKTDFGIVKVAFMVAALDGEVSDAELKAFDVLLKKCRGYSAKAAALALDEAMRSAGYLILLGRRVSDAQLIRAFMAEACAALPDGFAYLSVVEVRRAVVTWIAMGMSDGDYSVREKKCIEALRRHFAELKVSRDEAEKEQWLGLSSDRQFSGCVSPVVPVAFITRDFVSQVEKLVAQYGDRTDAANALEKLIAAE